MIQLVELENLSEEALATAWLEAKAEEEAATARRHTIEKILEHKLTPPSEGSVTHRLGIYKIRMTQKITRKVDPDAWFAIMEKIPPPYCPVKVVEEYKADDKICRDLALNHPALWALCSTAITSKPAKIGVTVEVVHGD